MKIKKLWCLTLFLSNIIIAQVSISNLSYPSEIGQYTVLEMTMNHDESNYVSTWDDVILQASITSPLGNNLVIDGFYYDLNTWKLRFAPSEIGNYTFNLSLNGTLVGNGTFNSIDVGEKGFVRQHPTNPFRLFYEDDNSLFSGLGVTGAAEPNPINPDDLRGNTTIPGWWVSEPPHAVFPWFLPDEPNESITGNHTMDEYFSVMSQTKGDFTRISLLNANGWSFFEGIIDNTAPSQYSVLKGKWADDLIKKFREEGFRIMLDPIGDTPKPLGSDVGRFDYEGYLEIALESAWPANERFLRYIVARYGAYVDFWDLINEGTYTDSWISQMAQYIKSIDPYNHMISASFVPYNNPDIDYGGFHSYYAIPDLLTADLIVVNNTNTLYEEGGICGSGNCSKSSFNKPIIFSEAGHITALSWSAGPIAISEEQTKLRIRSWVSFFNEGHNLFWAQHWNPERSSYLGTFFDTELRGYYANFHAFSNTISRNVVIDQNISISGGNDSGARVYGLRSNDELYFYIFNPQNDFANQLPSTNIVLTADIPISGIAEWFNPSTGQVVGTTFLTAGNQQQITVPTTNVDLAFRLTNNDIEQPSSPLNLVASLINTTSFQLDWTPSNDNVGVDNYRVFIDGVATKMVTTTNVQITDLNPGQTYRVKVSAVDANGNESNFSNQILVTTQGALGVENDLQNNGIKVFPNPAKDEFFISVQTPLETEEVTLVAMDGNQIQVRLKKISNQLAKFSVTSLSSGLYVLEVGSKKIKIIKLN